MKHLFLLLLITLTAFSAFAADGDLDATFGTGGVVITDNGTNGVDGIADLAVQTDGKIIAVGNSTPDFSSLRVAVIRYDVNGAIDTAFGTGGKVFINAASASAVTLQNDGKIVVVGQTGAQNNRDIYVVRLNADGSFDTAFGTNGEIRSDLRGSFDRATSVKIQADGKIVVGGSSSPPQGSSSFDDYAILRFNTNGTPDPAFGTNGRVFTIISPQASEVFAQGIYIQPNGKIVASGGGVVQINGSLVEAGVTVRYNADGSLDTSFDSDGIVLTQFAPGESQNRFTASSVAGQCDGKIVVAGFGRNAANPNGNFAVVRYNADGSLDNSFGSGGKVSIAFPSVPGSFALDLKIQADNKIVVAGNANGIPAVARLNANGSLDTTFSGDGVNTVATGTGSGANAVVIQPGGKIVLGGSRTANNNQDFLLARFDATSGAQTCSQPPTVNQETKKFDFDGDGKTDSSVVRVVNNLCQWYIRPSSSSGNQFYGVQFGLGTDKIAPADYDGDGKTDIAVWREGSFAYFYILQSSNSTVRSEQFGQTGDVLTVGDWDGDGKADPSVYREGAQSYFYYRGSLNNPNGNISAIPWGTNGDKNVRGDFDGDGKLDAAVYRASNQIWYIRNSSNNQITFTYFGLPTDKRISGDFDGDGKSDIAVVRDGFWIILQSSNSQIRYQNWGLSSDVLTPGDYDGDGKTDFAVWRNGIYYILNSGNSAFAYQYFGSSGDVPIASVYIQ